MARGSNAKLEITEKLRNLYGTDFIGIQDNKIYVWENDGAERVQIAIAMTCPKVGMESSTNTLVQDSSSPFEEQTVLPQSKKDEILAMMERLGI